MWVCHHRKETDENKTQKQLIKLGLYYQRPANELIFLTSKDHHRLHGAWNKGMKKEDYFTEDGFDRLKQKASHPGRLNGMYGYKWSDEQRKRMSQSQLNRNFNWDEDARLKMSKERTGEKWWNNGIANKRARECPDKDWKRGRLSSENRCLANKLVTLKRYNKKRMVALLHTILVCFS